MITSLIDKLYRWWYNKYMLAWVLSWQSTLYNVGYLSIAVPNGTDGIFIMLSKKMFYLTFKEENLYRVVDQSTRTLVALGSQQVIGYFYSLYEQETTNDF